MANHTEIIGDFAIPVGVYEVNEGGQKKRKTRHRNVGVVMRTSWDGGGESLSVRINAEVLNQSILTLISRAGVLPAGEDSVLCRIYEREKKPRDGANKADGADGADGEVHGGEPGPF